MYRSFLLAVTSILHALLPIFLHLRFFKKAYYVYIIYALCKSWWKYESIFHTFLHNMLLWLAQPFNPVTKDAGKTIKLVLVINVFVLLSDPISVYVTNPFVAMVTCEVTILLFLCRWLRTCFRKASIRCSSRNAPRPAHSQSPHLQSSRKPDWSAGLGQWSTHASSWLGWEVNFNR